MREQLRRYGFQVTSHTIDSAGHGTLAEFPTDAIKDWLELSHSPKGGRQEHGKQGRKHSASTTNTLCVFQRLLEYMYKRQTLTNTGPS